MDDFFPVNYDFYNNEMLVVDPQVDFPLKLTEHDIKTVLTKAKAVSHLGIYYAPYFGKKTLYHLYFVDSMSGLALP